MSILNMPRDQVFHIIQGTDVLELGSLTLTAATELRHLVLTLVKIGTRVGSERVRAKVFSDSAYSTLVATSDWATLADIETALSATSSQSWTARVRFDFGRTRLAASTAYYVGLSAENYTPVGDVFFVGVKADWPDQVNSGDELAGQFRVVGYK